MAELVNASAAQTGDIEIELDPERVYALISDVTRTGEWSPECYKCEWVGGANGPSVGARFRGYNRYRWLRWSRLNEVVTADPGREFAFKVLPDWLRNDSSIWRYRLEPAGGGTRLSETTQALVQPGRLTRLVTSLARRDEDMAGNIEQSLARIRAIAESEAK